ncbi:MAG: protein-methionine-sulfoxide reductase catalytic subunit MsrP [Alphaproteobacteria bacterium]
MLTRVKKRWEIAESQVTPESIYMNRRQLIKSAGLLGTGLAATGLGFSGQSAIASDDPSSGLYPAPLNAKYANGINPLTPEHIATSYNNYYEFGSSKSISKAAQKLSLRPWTVEIDGHVNKPGVWDIDRMLSSMPLEERIYRHRCVEAWAMTVPWSGFSLAALVKAVEPTSDAKYLRFETFSDPNQARGIKQSPWYPWPYIDGMTIEEATNELSFMVTGLYGKPLPKQNGAPLRLHLPWKYGFKHVKGIVKISFTKRRPVGFWEQLQKREYGFWANVNPEVPHKRWSQATERDIATNERRPTLKYNGYEEEVAGLYSGLEAELGNKLFF